MLVWELKKLLKDKKMLISTVLMLVLIVTMAFVVPQLDTDNSYYDSTGKHVEDKRDKNVIANYKLQTKVKSLNNLVKNKHIGLKDLNTDEIIEISREKLYKDSGKDYKNVTFYKVFNYRIANGFTDAVIAVVLIYIFSNIYTSEKQNKVDTIILSSKNKWKTLNSKLLLSILIPVVIYVLYVLVTGALTIFEYGIPQNGNLQAFRMVEQVILINSISINIYTLLNIFTMLMIFIGMGIFTCLFSLIASNSIQSIVAIVIFMLIGRVIPVLNILPETVNNVIYSSNYMNVTLYPRSFVGNFLGKFKFLNGNFSVVQTSYFMYILLIIVGIVLYLFVSKKLLVKL